MKQKRIACTLLFFCLMVAALFLVNWDVFHFSEIFQISRTFSGEIDDKGEKILIDDLVLKTGSYLVTLTGESTGPENVYIIRQDDNSVISDRIPEGKFAIREIIEIKDTIDRIQTLVDFASGSSSLTIDQIDFKSGHAVYKESILRHAVISLLLILAFLIIFLRIFYRALYCRIFKNLSQPEAERVLLFLILLTILVSIPFFNQNYVFTNDGYYHMIRIEGIKESLSAGQIPAWIHLFVLNDYGYGEGFYYPDLFLYLPAVIRLLGFSVLTTYKLFIAICNFLSFLSMYFAVRGMTKSRYAGLLSAMLYAFAAYRLIDIYYRGAVGEVLSFIFIPFVFWGIYEIYRGDCRKWWLIAIGYTGLIFSHMISLAIAGAATLVFVLLHISRTLKNRQIQIAWLKAFMASMALSAIFWLPMIEQLIKNDVIGDVLYSTVSYTIDSERLLSVSDLFVGFAPWDRVKPFLGYPLLFVIFIGIGTRLVEIRRKPTDLHLSNYLFFFGFLAAFMSTALFPWQWFAWFYNRIQFPWRMLVLATPLLAASGGILFDSLFEKSERRIFLTALFCFCAAVTVPFFNEVLTNRIFQGDGFRLENNRIMGAEYLPIHADKEFIDKNRNTVLSSESSFTNQQYQRSGLSYSVDFTVKAENGKKVTVEIPLLYYYGYQAILTNADGQKTALEVYQGAHGLTAVDIQGVSEGKIHVFYENTSLQKAAGGITFFTALLLLTAAIRKKNRIAADLEKD
jgi:hypothetical protein